MIINPFLIASLLSASVAAGLLVSCSVDLPGPAQSRPSLPSDVGDIAAQVDADVDLAALTDATDQSPDVPVLDVGDMPADEVSVPTYASCAELEAAGALSGPGVYALTVDDVIFDAYCDTVAGGGWTLVATITNDGDARDTGDWRPNADPNLWESNGMGLLGAPDPTVNADHRSPGFHLMPATDIRITWNNQGFIIANGCMPNQSLAGIFRQLDWNCDFNEQPSTCAMTCDITASIPRPGEVALLDSSDRTELYFKGGERDGADPGATDRVYLSTELRNQGNFVPGLGSLCAGTCGGRAGGVDVSLNTDEPMLAPDDQWYSIWIR